MRIRQLKIFIGPLLGVVILAAIVFVIIMYRHSTTFCFTLDGRNGDAIMSIPNARLMFKDVPVQVRSDGMITVGSLGCGKMWVNGGRYSLTQTAVSSRCTTVTFAGFVFNLTENGARLNYGTNSFQLTGKTTIVLRKNGTAEQLEQ